MKHDLMYVANGLLFVVAVYVLVNVVLPKLTEGFLPDSKVDHPCPPNSVKCPSGDCKLKGDIYGLCGYKP
jgi:hypothetical protein